MSAVQKIDSNAVGFRIAEEVSIGVLDPTPANQIWVELEPNSISEFGGAIKTVARMPFNPGRQRKKGAVVGQDASAGWMNDVTQTNMQSLLQGAFMASHRKKKEFTGAAMTVVTPANTYGASGIHTGSYAGDIILASGFTNSANNGVKNVTAAASNTITVSETLANETSAATAKLVTVGYKFAASDAVVVVSGQYPVINTTTKDCTQLGLIPGEFVYIGGDNLVDRFGNAQNNGFARVKSVTTNQIVFDKTSATWVADSGSGKQIRLWKARLLKNELGSSIVRRTYTLEAILGANDTADLTKEQAAYVKGFVPGELTLNFKNTDKLTAEIKGIGLNSTTLDENVSGANTLLSKISGVVRQAVVEADAFNLASDPARVRLAVFTPGTTFPTRLFTYGEEFTLNINNNLSPLPAVGVLGAFDINAGKFEVSGSFSAYFSNVSAYNSVLANADVTLDVALVRNNAGVVLDLPCVGLGNGLPKFEQDKPVMIPLDTGAYTGAKIDANMNHTAMFHFFDYLPTVAATAVS